MIGTFIVLAKSLTDHVCSLSSLHYKVIKNQASFGNNTSIMFYLIQLWTSSTQHMIVLFTKLHSTVIKSCYLGWWTFCCFIQCKREETAKNLRLDWTCTTAREWRSVFFCQPCFMCWFQWCPYRTKRGQNPRQCKKRKFVAREICNLRINTPKNGHNHNESVWQWLFVTKNRQF